MTAQSDKIKRPQEQQLEMSAMEVELKKEEIVEAEKPKTDESKS